MNDEDYTPVAPFTLDSATALKIGGWNRRVRIYRNTQFLMPRCVVYYPGLAWIDLGWFTIRLRSDRFYPKWRKR